MLLFAFSSAGIVPRLKSRMRRMKHSTCPFHFAMSKMKLGCVDLQSGSLQLRDHSTLGETPLLIGGQSHPL